MGYKLRILTTDGKSIPGEIDFYDGSYLVGFTQIPVGGTDLPDEAAQGWKSALVTSPGYQGLSVPYINEDTDFILIKKANVWLWAAGAAAATLLIMKFAKVR